MVNIHIYFNTNNYINNLIRNFRVEKTSTKFMTNLILVNFLIE